MDVVMYVTIISGITEVVKKAKLIPSSYCGLLSLSLGLVLGVFLGIESGSFFDGLMFGAMFGLSASGAYSTGKNTIRAIKK